MDDFSRTFAVASDETLIALIKSAQDRLAVVAPALTTPVAEALAARLDDLDRLALTVVLDADAEVYRMGYGDPEALEIIRKASLGALFDLREQPGVRIGVVIADDTTLVYAPVSRNIEAGSTNREKPNAILLNGLATEKLAEATGIAQGETEIGCVGMAPERVEAMHAELKANPPKPFDLTRKLTVFTSAVEFVELRVSNCRLGNRQVPLPEEFIGVGDATLQERISGRMRTPLDGIKAKEITIEINGKTEKLIVDQKFIDRERKEIEDTFTYVLPNKGRIILKRDRPDFDRQIVRFENILKAYQEAIKTGVENARDAFCKQMVEEFTPRWLASPPRHLQRRSGPLDRTCVTAEIGARADELFTQAIDFDPPEVTVGYKGIVIDDICDVEFRSNLRSAMVKVRVDKATLDQLFEIRDAAAAQVHKSPDDMPFKQRKVTSPQ